MNPYLLFGIILFVLFIPVSIVGVDASDPTQIEFKDAIFPNEKNEDTGKFYVFVQVVQRDSNGNLIAVLQSDKMTNINPNTVNYYIDSRGNYVDIPVYNFDGVYVQAYGEKFTDIQPIHDLTASTLLVVEIPNEDNPDESQSNLAARFAHDGLVMATGDIMETHWYVARLLD